MTKTERVEQLINEIVLKAELNNKEIIDFKDDCNFFKYDIEELKELKEKL